MGRGTTLLEAALLDRVPYGCDVNPLSTILVQPRLGPPSLEEVEARLNELDLTSSIEAREDLLAFYSPVTLTAVANLRKYFSNRRAKGENDRIDGQQKTHRYRDTVDQCGIMDQQRR